ncbi:hypothetical protein [Ideonella sp. BN130291]|uniref:hypothetical protein n=1 Tax=Ideonella sp. BN130291 TaxID=3112940 RepID=UPI002E271D21|nr:hypothetical protein [Ideonella sp. BN130291]
MPLPPLALTLLRAALAAGLAANGLAMLLAPAAWYHAVPGVPFTGPLNTHFVRDIGCAYLVAAAGLAWRAWRADGAAAALAGAAFLLLHAGVHLGETLAGLCGWATFWRDVPGVVLPALLAGALAWPARPTSLPSPRRSAHA